MNEVRLRYKGQTQSLTATVIRTWKRGDLSGPVMSASSGPKDYLKNDIWSVFALDLDIDAVALIMSAKALFVLVQKKGKTYDLKTDGQKHSIGNEVEVQKRKDSGG